MTESRPRFWIDAPLAAGADIELPESAVRHVAALRLHEGEPVTVFDGSGGEHEATLARPERGRCRARVGRKREVERESPLEVMLALGLSAGDRMDFAVQKAVELGVSAIVPLATERSVVHLSGERAERRIMHWRRVAASACEQCGRNRLPALEPVTALDDLLLRPRDGLKLILSPEAGQRLAALPRSESVLLLIGPEGGWSAREQAAALAADFVALQFGPRILRTETAPLAALAALQALWGDC